MGIGEWRAATMTTYLHGKDAGRGVGHGSKALDAGEGRGGNSEHGELHGYKLMMFVRRRDGPQVRNCERRWQG